MAGWGGGGPPSLILQNDVESVDDTRQVTQDGEQDVDEEVGTTATLEEDTNGGQDDGKENLADVASGERHVGGCVRRCRVVKMWCWCAKL